MFEQISFRRKINVYIINRSAEKNINISRYEDEKNDINFCSKDISINLTNDKVLSIQEEIIDNENSSIIGFMLGDIYDIDINKSSLK